MKQFFAHNLPWWSNDKILIQSCSPHWCASNGIIYIKIWDLCLSQVLVLTWIGHVIYQSMCFWFVTFILCFYFSLIESYWQKRLLSWDGFRWFHEGSVRKHWTISFRLALISLPLLNKTDPMSTMEVTSIPIFTSFESQWGVHKKMAWHQVTDSQNLRHTDCRHRWPHQTVWVWSHYIHDCRFCRTANLPTCLVRWGHLIWAVGLTLED